jgi:hypothetical protein
MSFNPYPSVPSSYSYRGNVIAVQGFLNVIGIDRARQGGCVKQAVGAELHMGNIRDRLAIRPGQCHFKEVGSHTLSPND